MDINDSWDAILKIIAFWQANPQFAELRNSLVPGERYYNDPDQLMIGNRGLSLSEAEAQMGMVRVSIVSRLFCDSFESILMNSGRSGRHL